MAALRGWRGHALLTAVAVVWLTTACGVDGSNEAVWKHLDLVLDPTVYNVDQRKRAETLVEELANRVRITENTVVAVWLLKQNMTVTPGPAIEMTFELDRRELDDGNHRRRVESWIKGSVKPVYLDAWTAAHADQKTPATCIVTALYAVVHHAAAKQARGRSILLVSDLVEVCSDWKGRPPINFERQLEEGTLTSEVSPLTPTAASSIDLSSLERVVILDTGSAYVTTPVDVEMLHTIWSSALMRLRLRGRPEFLRSIPPKLALP